MFMRSSHSIDEAHNSSPIDEHQPSPLLSIQNLTVSLQTKTGTVQAVNNVNLTVNAGETLGLVGESGCGKSVLCKTVIGLLPHNAQINSAAQIIYGQQDLASINERQFCALRGNDIAMVFQDPMTSLNPVMKIGDQITETLLHNKITKKNEAPKEAARLLTSVGVPMPEKRLSQYPHQLSGGIRQRVVIAITLACRPKLLIADEPTTALDVTVQAEILELLRDIQQQRQMAMILVSHDLGVIAGMSHKTAVMYAGNIVEHGPSAALFDEMRMPYTRALMDSIPRLDDSGSRLLKTIDGQPPNLIDPPVGCRFEPRCSRSLTQCKKKAPSFTEDKDDHFYACWNPISYKGPA